MRAEDGGGPALRGFPEQSAGQLEVRLVHVPLPRKRHVRRLAVGAFDQPDPGLERQQGLEVFGGAAQICLEGDPDVRARPARGAIDLEGLVHVRRLLHVEPQQRACGLGARRQLVDCAAACARIGLEPQVGELHGDVGSEAAPLDLAEDLQVVAPYGVGLVSGAHLLAELGEHGADVLGGEP